MQLSHILVLAAGVTAAVANPLLRPTNAQCAKSGEDCTNPATRCCISLGCKPNTRATGPAKICRILSDPKPRICKTKGDSCKIDWDCCANHVCLPVGSIPRGGIAPRAEIDPATGVAKVPRWCQPHFEWPTNDEDAEDATEDATEEEEEESD